MVLTAEFTGKLCAATWAGRYGTSCHQTLVSPSVTSPQSQGVRLGQLCSLTVPQVSWLCFPHLKCSILCQAAILCPVTWGSSVSLRFSFLLGDWKVGRLDFSMWTAVFLLSLHTDGWDHSVYHQILKYSSPVGCSLLYVLELSSQDAVYETGCALSIVLSSSWKQSCRGRKSSSHCFMVNLSLTAAPLQIS